MAEKRMFSLSVVDTDWFLDLPLSTQALYFHLNMRADDDGFVDAPNSIVRKVGASKNDFDLLLAKRYILQFDSGIIVIKHWRMHNTIRQDRIKHTQFQEELKTLRIKENGSYTDNLGEAKITCQPSDNQVTTEMRQNDSVDIDIESDIDIDKEDISNDISYSNYSIDSPKIEKNQSKNPVYNLIFDTWNSEKPLIHHQELTPIREKAIDKALKNFQTAQIVDAIKHYAMVLRSQYRFTYKWDLETFLKQENAMPRFTDEGGIWNSFLEAVNENPLILALEDRTEDVPKETPDCIKNFMDKIK